MKVDLRKELSTATTLFMVFGVICIFTGIVGMFLYLKLSPEIGSLGQEVLISDVTEKYTILNLITFELYLLLISVIFLLVIGILDIITMQFLWKLKKFTRIVGLVSILLAVFFGLYRLEIFFSNPLRSNLEFFYSLFLIAFNLIILISFTKLWKYLKK